MTWAGLGIEWPDVPRRTPEDKAGKEPTDEQAGGEDIAPHRNLAGPNVTR